MKWLTVALALGCSLLAIRFALGSHDRRRQWGLSITTSLIASGLFAALVMPWQAPGPASGATPSAGTQTLAESDSNRVKREPDHSRGTPSRPEVSAAPQPLPAGSPDRGAAGRGNGTSPGAQAGKPTTPALGPSMTLVMVSHSEEWQNSVFSIDGKVVFPTESNLRFTAFMVSPGSHEITAVMGAGKCTARFSAPHAMTIPLVCQA